VVQKRGNTEDEYDQERKLPSCCKQVGKRLLNRPRNQPYNCGRNQVDRDRQSKEDKQKNQPVEREWLFRIKEFQPLYGGREEIPDAKRVHQNQGGTGLLSNGPENADEDRRKGYVNDLLPEKMSQR
jgi:hypothetical protein